MHDWLFLLQKSQRSQVQRTVTTHKPSEKNILIVTSCVQNKPFHGFPAVLKDFIFNGQDCKNNCSSSVYNNSAFCSSVSSLRLWRLQMYSTKNMKWLLFILLVTDFQVNLQTQIPFQDILRNWWTHNTYLVRWYNELQIAPYWSHPCEVGGVLLYSLPLYSNTTVDPI